jgi:hypothetical protein
LQDKIVVNRNSFRIFKWSFARKKRININYDDILEIWSPKIAFTQFWEIFRSRSKRYVIYGYATNFYFYFYFILSDNFVTSQSNQMWKEGFSHPWCCTTIGSRAFDSLYTIPPMKWDSLELSVVVLLCLGRPVSETAFVVCVPWLARRKFCSTPTLPHRVMILSSRII